MVVQSHDYSGIVSVTGSIEEELFFNVKYNLLLSGKVEAVLGICYLLIYCKVGILLCKKMRLLTAN